MPLSSSTLSRGLLSRAPRSVVGRVLILALSLGGWQIAPALASEGTVIQNRTLYQLEDLGTDDPEITPLIVFEAASIQGAIRIDDEWLAIGRLVGGSDQQLMRFAAETGVLLDSGPLTLPTGSSFVVGLERGPAGDLLVFSGGSAGGSTSVGSLDPATGVVSERFVIGEDFGGLMLVQGEAYTLVSDFEAEEMSLARLDFDTGTLDELAALPSTACSSAGDLAFDQGGALHIAVQRHDCGIILPALEFTLASYQPFDLASPPAELELLDFEATGFGGFAPVALEVTGGVSPIDVPLGLPTTLGLLLGLTAAGWLILRARPA